ESRCQWSNGTEYDSASADFCSGPQLPTGESVESKLFASDVAPKLTF
ncbi:unnamed protein product, partial [Tenebrio molitor]